MNHSNVDAVNDLPAGSDARFDGKKQRADVSMVSIIEVIIVGN